MQRSIEDIIKDLSGIASGMFADRKTEEDLCREAANRLKSLQAENERLQLCVGYHQNADAYRSEFPDNEEDAKYLRRNETENRLITRTFINEEIEKKCNEAWQSHTAKELNLHPTSM